MFGRIETWLPKANITTKRKLYNKGFIVNVPVVLSFVS